MKKNIKSTGLLFLTAIIWGLAFVAQRVGAEFLGAFTFNGIRFLLGAVSLIPVILLFEKEKVTKKELKTTVIAGIGVGVILFLASTFQQIGVELTGSAGKAGFLTGLYIILVPIINLIFGKKTGIFTFFGAIFALVGLAFLCMVGDKITFSMGEIVLILCALFFAAHILVIDRLVNDISPLKFSMVQFLTCGIISLLVALFTEDIQLVAIKGALIPLLYGGIMSVGVAYTCQTLGQKEADPTFASIVFSTESVFSAIGGAIILGEKMSSSGYIGCVLIFIGIVLSQINMDFMRKIFRRQK